MSQLGDWDGDSRLQQAYAAGRRVGAHLRDQDRSYEPTPKGPFPKAFYVVLRGPGLPQGRPHVVDRKAKYLELVNLPIDPEAVHHSFPSTRGDAA